MNFYTNVQLIGDTVLYRGYENGESVIYKESFSPTLFVQAAHQTEYKTLDEKYVEPIKFSGVKEAREFIKQYEQIENFSVYGNEKFLYQYISERFPEEEILYDISNINLISLDIETTSENGFPSVEEAIEEILCITIKNFTTKKFITWGCGEFDNKNPNVTYHYCKDERELLMKFLSWWVQNTPDIVTGWNVKFFDIPFICRRINRIFGQKHLNSFSPWNKVTEGEVYIKGRKNIFYTILGVSILDYLDLYKKFTYTGQESYRLDHIAWVELEEKKLDHSEYENFQDFYRSDWQKFIEYNIHDVELVDRLEDKMKLIELAITMAYDAKVNFEDVYSQVRMWDTIIYNELKRENIVIPPKIESHKDKQYAGAYVKEPVPGIYDWVVNFDLNSLYPHLIMQYNISPETLLEHRHPKATVDRLLNKEIDLHDLHEQTLCANGTFYNTNKQGVLPKLMEKMYNDRVIYKTKMLQAKQEYENTKNAQLLKDISRYNNIQMAKKIQLNSAYGAIGNEHFRYFRIENAEAITLSGQLSIKWIERSMNQYLNKILKTDEIDYVIACDTDSMYLNLGDLVQRVFKGREKTDEKVVNFLDKVCKVELEPFIENSYKELAEYVNAYDQKMSMKRENIANKGIWTGKKRYILNVWDSEGVRYKKPKMKICGMETVRSSTPGYYRDKLKTAYEIIINQTNNDLIDYITKIRIETKNQNYVDIATSKGVNNIAKYTCKTSIYKRGQSTPIHVRGTLLYNHLVGKYKINNKYPIIQEGEKIKYLYLKQPNPIGENVISFFQNIPKEFGLDNYVDYDTQFDKSFLNPLKTVLDCIGWKSEHIGNLSNFFS
jgi:DNA polymerase elongation subunit (family B)